MYVHAHSLTKYKCVVPPYCRVEMYAGRVACCTLASLVSMPTGQTDGRTDGRTSDRYITLSATDAASLRFVNCNCWQTAERFLWRGGYRRTLTRLEASRPWKQTAGAILSSSLHCLLHQCTHVPARIYTVAEATACVHPNNDQWAANTPHVC